MSKKWSAEDEEMPSLISNSDTSRSDFDNSPHGQISDCEDESSFNSHYSSDCNNNNNNNANGAHHDDDNVIRKSPGGNNNNNNNNRGQSSPPRRRSPASPPRRPRSRSRSRPLTSRIQHQQHQQQQPHRSRSRPRKQTQSRARFSYSRRSSIGGTTLYQTHHMAALDNHLRSTSGLRLQKDGTCNFLFDDQKFVIENAADEGTGDFLFYASFGALKDLQRRNKGRNLLRVLATWNEGLKERGAAKKNNTEGENSGLLRIDSSKQTGPHVAFIYYGHMEEIRNSAHFQEMLDDFVDDALECSDMLHGVNNEKDNGEMIHTDPSHYSVPPPPSVPVSGSKSRQQDKVVPPPPPPSRQESFNNQHQAPNSDNGGRSKFNKDPNQKEAATPAATSAETATTTTTEGAITSTDVYNAYAKKPNVFSKMIQSIRSKSNADNITANAFVDPSNPSSAFVVDKNAGAPSINLSRTDSAHHAASLRKGGSFHNRTNTDDTKNKERSHHPQKGRSFHVGDDYTVENSASQRRHVRNKSTSFSANDDNHNGHHPQQQHSRHTRSTSFHVDDGRGAHHRSKKTSSSFHNVVDNHHNDSSYPSASIRAKSKSFHYADNSSAPRKRNSNLTTEESSTDYECERPNFNASIDIYESQQSKQTTAGSMARGGLGNLHQSEPIVSQQRYPDPPPVSSRHCGHSRRHSTVTTSSSSRHSRPPPQSKRHSLHDEESRGRTSRHRSKSRSRKGSRMNQSEPILSQQRV